MRSHGSPLGPALEIETPAARLRPAIAVAVATRAPCRGGASAHQGFQPLNPASWNRACIWWRWSRRHAAAAAAAVALGSSSLVICERCDLGPRALSCVPLQYLVRACGLVVYIAGMSRPIAG